MEISRARSTRDPETYQIIGAAMVVHRELGHGFLKATNFNRGLLLNFGAESLQYERLSNKWQQSAQSAQSLIKNQR